MQILILIALLILVNAFFAASEMALVSIKPMDVHRLKKQGKKHALTLEKVTHDSTQYLSTIQVAITLAGFISSAFAGSRLSGDFVTLLERINISIPNTVAVIMITFILSYVTLVLGELVPKRIAITNPVKFALFCAPIILGFMKLFTPFVYLLSLTTHGVLKLLRIHSKNDDTNITESEIKEMIVYGQIEGLYKTEEKNMMKRIFSLDDLTAKMIMTPKEAIVSLNLDEPNVDEVINSRYSRIPVFSHEYKKVEGIIFLKDLLIELKDNPLDKIDLKSLIRKPILVHQHMKLNLLLKQMRDTFEHFTFIVNDSKEIIGIITLEDIIEEIVGNIYDEHDFVGEGAESLNEFGYIFDGAMAVTDIEEKLDINFENKESSSTIAEYIKSTYPKALNKEKKTIETSFGTIRILSKSKDKILQVELKLDQTKLKD